MHRKYISFAVCLFFLFTQFLSFAVSAQENEDWVKRSNRHAQVLLNVLAASSPETAGQLGIEGLDAEILDLKPGFTARNQAALEKALSELKSRLKTAVNADVRQDLEILIAAADENLTEISLNEKYLTPYLNVSQIIYRGLRALLDEQVAAERRPAALTRLKRYVGAETGYAALTDLAITYMRSEFDRPGRIGPFRDEVERDIENSDRFVKEIGELFEKYEIADYQAPYEQLEKQVADFNRFIEAELLPRSRNDYRLPRPIYEFNLKSYGVDMPVDELEHRAKVSFKELQNSLASQAILIARERNLESDDYRDVIRALKKEQLTGEDILTHYQQRIKDLEAIVRREAIVTLPKREMRFRLASEAESAVIPAPFMQPPRFIGNTGEQGEFVLPLKFPGGAGGEDLLIDDFLHDAVSWPLTVHEGRPGHEMQFASVIEKGVSLARALFAINSVNVEGWALYMEEEMKPYLPVEGQFMTLFSRLVRSARAFLDPGLNIGSVTQDEALRILSDEVVLSNAMARSELQRYTFRAPGQATSYFCGYLRLMELRTETELLLGEAFNRQDYHDFILSQGFLPPAQLRTAIMTQFVPGVKNED